MITPDIRKVLDFAHREEIYPDIQTIEGIATNPEVLIDGEPALIFCSNNYLGVSGEQEITDAVVEGVKRYGMGYGGSRLVSGNTDIQSRLGKMVSGTTRVPLIIQQRQRIL